MQVQYRIKTDSRRQLVRITLAGHWDASTVHGYQLDLDRALRELAASGGVPGQYLTLADLRDQSVQSRDVAREFQALVGRYASLSRRTALLMSDSVLHRMQVTRICGEQLVFADEGSALAWLLEPQLATA